MEEGHIKWYSEAKGYGFITKNDGDELFFHKSGVESQGHFGIRKDDRVSFEVQSSARGLKAVRVKVL